MPTSRRFPVLAALAVLALPAAARAQSDPSTSASASGTRPIRIGFGGGVIVPRQGASVRTVRQGVQGQGFVVFQLPGGLPALRANVDFARMRVESPLAPGASSIAQPGAPTTEETIRSMLAGVASLKVDLLRGPVRPYVLAGVGAFRLADKARGDGAAAATTADPAAQLDFGVEGGAGISLRLGPIDAFAETRLQNVYTKQRGMIDTRAIRAFPVTFGITL